MSAPPPLADDGRMHPFRFLTPPQGWFDGAKLAAFARQAETIGYDELIVNDHVVEQLAPVPVLATAAAATERLRLGAFVFNAALRHPAVLAQELATLDVLSGGRLRVGIGAGWNKPEHLALGLPFEPVGTRIARLAEAVAVLKGCFGPGPFSFDGEHYRITAHDGPPKPVQRPHPPFFIGGGSRKVLSLAAREAQGVGLSPRMLPGDQSDPKPDARTMTAAATEEKVRWVREAAGDRFDTLELNTYTVFGPLVITSDARGEAGRRADVIRHATGIELTVEEVMDSPHVFIGTVRGIVAKFTEMRERFGISSIVLDDPETSAPIVQALAGR